MSTAEPREFDAEQTARLLGELHERLRDRGIAAAVFVVGGAAIAVTGIRAGRITEDIDALAGKPAVAEEARAMAAEKGLPPHWLNGNAGMWMPPLPDGVLDPPAEPGLRVTYADEGFLLATKLIAQRSKDADDLRALAARAGLASATPAQLETHIRRYYTDPDALEMIVGGKDVDREIALLAQDASRMLKLAEARRKRMDAPTRDTPIVRREPPGIGF